MQGVGFTGVPEETRHGGSSGIRTAGSAGASGGPRRGRQDPFDLAGERGSKATAGSWPFLGPRKEDPGHAGNEGLRVVNPQFFDHTSGGLRNAAGFDSQNGQ